MIVVCASCSKPNRLPASRAKDKAKCAACKSPLLPLSRPPELEKLAGARAGGLVVAKVDTEALPAVAARFNIRSIPTMILFHNGKEAARLSGAMPASRIASELRL